MSADAVAAGRAAAEARMLDTCTITRAGATPGPWHEESMTYLPTAGEGIYSGPCRVVAVNAAATGATVGEREVSVVRWEVHLPVDGSGAVRARDVVEVTAAEFDPSLVGRRFVVTSPHAGSQLTARRLPAEALT